MRTDGRTDIFWKSFIFSSWSRIYIHVYTYLDYFSNFTPILTKVSIPFFHLGNRYENMDFKIAQSRKISFGSSFISLRAFGSKFWQFRLQVYTFQTKTALDYLYPLLSFCVHNFCTRTDIQTFFEKVFLYIIIIII